MSNNEYFIHYLTEKDSEEIVALRKHSYSKQFQSEVKMEGLIWNKTDQNSIHLGLKNDQNELLSIIRISFFLNKENLENSTGTQTPEEVLFPCALLSRAATNPSHASIGLHQILRLAALEHISKSNYPCVLGTMKKNASRLNHLLNIGYSILYEADKWVNSFINSSEPIVLIGLIGENKIKEAINKLKVHMACNLKNKVNFQDTSL